MISKINFGNSFDPYICRFKKITIDEESSKKLATQIAHNIKMKKISLKRDLNEYELNQFKKIYMKNAGDIIIDQLFGLNTVDYNNIMNMEKPTINNIITKANLDIITFSYGIFPLVYKKNYKKTILICMLNKREFYVCGFAAPDLLNFFSKSELVLSNILRENGRCGFFGFDKLGILTSDLGELIEFINSK